MLLGFEVIYCLRNLLDFNKINLIQTGRSISKCMLPNLNNILL